MGSLLIFDTETLDIILLAIRFMTVSTVLMGAVWFLESRKILKKTETIETAWKAAIVGSVLACLPFTPNLNTIEFTPDSVGVNSDVLPLHQASGAAISSISTAHELAHQATNIRETKEYSESTENPLVTIDRDYTETNRPVEPVLVNANGVENRQSPEEQFVINAPSPLFVWFLFSLGCALHLGVSYLLTMRGLGKRTPLGAPHPAHHILADLSRRMEIDYAVKLSVSNKTSSPLCLPFNEICLPHWAVDDVTEDQLKNILAHELAHLKRHDTSMLLITKMLERIFFFQPMFRLARKRLIDLSEFSADAMTVRHVGNPKGLAEALFVCAQKNAAGRQENWSFAMTGKPSQLKLRIKALVKDGYISSNRQSIKKISLYSLGIMGALTLPEISVIADTSNYNPSNPATAEIADNLPSTATGESINPIPSVTIHEIERGSLESDLYSLSHKPSPSEAEYIHNTAVEPSIAGFPSAAPHAITIGKAETEIEYSEMRAAFKDNLKNAAIEGEVSFADSIDRWLNSVAARETSYPKRSKYESVLTHPSFKDFDRFDLREIIPFSIKYQLVASGVEKAKYRLHITSLRVPNYGISRFSTTVPGGGGTTGGAVDGNSFIFAKGKLQILNDEGNIAVEKPIKIKQGTFDLRSLSKQGYYDEYGMKALTIHFSNVVAEEIIKSLNHQKTSDIS